MLILATVVSFTWPNVSTIPLFILAVVFNVGFSLFFFPFSKTIWAALDYALHPLEPDEVEESHELVHLRGQMLVKHGDLDRPESDYPTGPFSPKSRPGHRAERGQLGAGHDPV